MEESKTLDTPPKNGSCLGHDPNIFFPFSEKSGDSYSRNYVKGRENTILAKSICENCLVSEECLQYSLRHEPFGIWGGKTERERKTLRRRLGIQIVPREPINILLGFKFGS
jgi:hypothetical protein